jgi:hypothetical protein
MDSEAEGSLRLRAVPRIAVVLQLVAGAVSSVVALVNIAGHDPSGWEQLPGVAATRLGPVER